MIARMVLALGLLLPLQVWASPSSPVHWADLTGPQLQVAIEQGYTQVILPTAGIEHNGPDLPLDKHKHIIRKAAEELAIRLGKTLVAPVIEFVPEGDISTRSGHMGRTGTISARPETFEALLRDTIESLLAHGITSVIMIGDSAGNQVGQARVAKALQARHPDVQILHCGFYYNNPWQAQWLARRRLSSPGAFDHAGFADQAEYAFVSKTGPTPLQALGAGLLEIKVQAAMYDLNRRGLKGRSTIDRLRDNR